MSDWIRKHLPFLGDDDDDSADATGAAAVPTEDEALTMFYGVGKAVGQVYEDTAGALSDLNPFAENESHPPERADYLARREERVDEKESQDSDEDGFLDEDERYAGTDPFDPVPTTRDEFNAGVADQLRSDAAGLAQEFEDARVERIRDREMEDFHSDTDEDGVPDRVERAAGSDWRDDTSVPPGVTAEDRLEWDDERRQWLDSNAASPARPELLRDSDGDGSYDQRSLPTEASLGFDPDDGHLADAKMTIAEGDFEGVDSSGGFLLRRDSDGDGVYDQEHPISSQTGQTGQSYDPVTEQVSKVDYRSYRSQEDWEPSEEADPTADLTGVAGSADSMIDDLDPFAGDDPGEDVDGAFD